MSTAKKLIDSLKEEVKISQNKIDPTYLKLVEIFPLQTITSKSQHEMALKVLNKLITFVNNEKSDDNGVEIYFKTLTELVGDYERIYYGIGKISGAEMLDYLIELHGLNQVDLSKDLGGQSVVSKILSGERELNIRQVRALARRFKVSPEVFI